MKKQLHPAVVGIILALTLGGVGFYFYKATGSLGNKAPGEVGNPSPFNPGGDAIKGGYGKKKEATASKGAPAPTAGGMGHKASDSTTKP